MDELLIALLLGILEGLTEFIPVSSTGHLIVAIDVIGFNAPPGKVFEIVIQLGAIGAICWLYRDKLWRTATGYLTGKAKDQRFAHAIVIAFLPAAVIGVMAHGFIKSVLFSAEVVGAMLIIGGVAILLIEAYKPAPKIDSVDHITLTKALQIGFCQVLAMIPGTSRSGATIMGSLLLGLDRKTAAEFSFFLAIPTMLGATVYDLYKNYQFLTLDAIELIAAGFISAFIAALFVVRWFIAFIGTHGFVPFAYYRMVVGSVILLWVFA